MKLPKNMKRQVIQGIAFLIILCISFLAFIVPIHRYAQDKNFAMVIGLELSLVLINLISGIMIGRFF